MPWASSRVPGCGARGGRARASLIFRQLLESELGLLPMQEPPSWAAAPGWARDVCLPPPLPDDPAVTGLSLP